MKPLFKITQQMDTDGVAQPGMAYRNPADALEAAANQAEQVIGQLNSQTLMLHVLGAIERLREAAQYVRKNPTAGTEAEIKTAGHRVVPPMNPEDYPQRPGLEGPFRQPSGKVLYYDPKAGQYYDPSTDMYVSNEDYEAHQQTTPPGWRQTMSGKVFDLLRLSASESSSTLREKTAQSQWMGSDYQGPDEPEPPDMDDPRYSQEARSLDFAIAIPTNSPLAQRAVAAERQQYGNDPTFNPAYVACHEALQQFMSAVQKRAGRRPSEMMSGKDCLEEQGLYRGHFQVQCDQGCELEYGQFLDMVEQDIAQHGIMIEPEFAPIYGGNGQGPEPKADDLLHD